MKSNLSKQEIQNRIKKVFSKNSTSEEIKKIKKLAASKNIKLKYERKKFCRKCYSLFNSDSQIRMKKGFKIVKCKCGYINKYKIKQNG
jgi:hypothetical protein